MEMTDQDSIARYRAPRHCQRFAVVRPRETEDPQVGKVSDLFRRPAINGLLPQIGRSALSELVEHPLAVWRPLKTARDAREIPVIEELHRLAACEGHKEHAALAELLNAKISEPFSIRRNGRLSREGFCHLDFFTAVHALLPQSSWASLKRRINQPLAVRRNIE
jgi:hypothetical protein